jgi:hypothetical protein
MAKKCIPGVICIENMTLFFLVLVLVLFIYFYYIHFVKISNKPNEIHEQKIVVVSPPNDAPYLGPLVSLSARRDPFNDPYYPPVKTDALFYPPNSGDIRGIPMMNPGIPINVETRGLNTGFQQVGILTRNGKQNDDMILPLMGRRLMSGRDKWQFYTISNSGSLNTKLPIKINGRSCTNEYGCDDINNGDTVYVEGYSEVFRVTKYENSSLFQYIPVL